MSSQYLFDNRITVRDIPEIIKFGHRRNRAVFIYGGAGVGKSDKVQQVANELFPLYIGQNLVDIRLSDKEPTDVTGVPVPVQMPDGSTQTVYAIPSYLPKDPNWCGIILLDELTNASVACQQAAYQIMLDGKIGDYVFPRNAIRVGAGNRDGDGGATVALLRPLANRMVIVEVEYNLDVWIEDFATVHDVHTSIIGYVKQFPDKFYTGDDEQLEDGMPFSTPRSLVGASDALKDFDQKLMSEHITGICIQGMLGKGVDTEVMAYHQRALKLPTIADILSGKVKVHHLDRADVDLLYVVSMGCMSELRKMSGDLEYSDTEVLDACHNFLTFMHENYGREHMDIIVAQTVNIFNGSGNKQSILKENPKREKMMPRLLAHSPRVGTIVKEYTSKYTDLMQGIDC